MEPEPSDNPAPPEAPPRPDDPRKRMMELQRIPERNRTDAQWDELNELEIRFAPGNRIDSLPRTANFAPSAAGQPRTANKKPMGRRNHTKRPVGKPRVVTDSG